MGATEVQAGYYHHHHHYHHNNHCHHHHCYRHHQTSANLCQEGQRGQWSTVFSMSSSFFQKHYWSQHQEWSRNAIIPKVSVRMELKCKQKLFKINYTGNKIHLIVFKSEYKQLQWLSYKHTNIWWLALLNIRRSMRRTENDWMRGISKYVCHVFLVCFSIETTIMFFSSPLFCFWIETTFMFSLLPCFPFPLKPYSSRSATLFSPDSCRKTILDRWHFLKKKNKIIFWIYAFIQCTLSST